MNFAVYLTPWHHEYSHSRVLGTNLCELKSLSSAAFTEALLQSLWVSRYSINIDNVRMVV